MIITNPKDLPAVDNQWALLDLQDHGEVEIIDGRWIDRHGYLRKMAKLCEQEKTVKFDANSASVRAAKLDMKGRVG